MSKAPLTAAIIAALALGVSAGAHASASSPTNAGSVQATSPQAAATQSEKKEQGQRSKTQQMKQVTVTGSLIPQTEIETATPLTTITAEDMKVKGFSTVADALQSMSFSTGTTQGPQFSGGFTQGAETLSFFGLPVGFTKYLINGRPMGNFPALYNGSDAFNNIAGIPADLVDHIDILPGGQSSLYGSDAIAGVINIVLKQQIDAPTLDFRYGWTTKGGGSRRRLSGADSWQWGDFKLLAGFQYENVSPIYGFDRNITSQYYRDGTSPPTASRDFLVYSATGNGYYFEDPNNCANVTGLFRGTEGKRTRVNSGQYCGTFYSPGYRSIANGKETSNFYTHATYDLNSNVQFYGDLLYKYSEIQYVTGSNYTFWSTSPAYGYVFEPDLGDFVTFQRAFAPEDIGPGGYGSIANTDTENAYFLTLGANGTIGESSWDWDLGFTHSDDHLIQHDWVRFNDAINDYFASHVFGPQLGVDPVYGAYPVFRPDYDAFYRPISPADFASFTGFVDTRSKTWDNLVRAQFTNASLFSLPGGEAGLAVVAEGGNSGWDNAPDPLFLNGGIWGQSATQGAGHRSRYALTTELRLPVIDQITLDLSGRRDGYKAGDRNFGKTTYMAGIEVRPIDSILLRGRYGTAFKAPTLPDEFQGKSGYYSFVTDYYNCALLGYSGANIGSCPAQYGSVQFQGTQSGNTGLKPINAKVWNYGIVWAPLSNLDFSVDYYHTDIDNKVNQQSAGQLSLDESRCRLGGLDINSPTCTNAIAQITRDQRGNITAILTPKVNVSNEVDNALVAKAHYTQAIGRFGQLHFSASYSDILKHEQQDYPGDPYIDLLRHPGYSTDFKTKGTASITWTKNPVGVTLYARRYGSIPNYAAELADNYTDEGTGTLPPWVIYNASVRYQATSHLQLSFLVDNVLNNMPPADHTYPGTEGAPYESFNYNPYGRTMYLEANYKF